MNTSYFSEFLTLAILHLLVVISPGANFTVVAKNSLTLTRQLALYTAFGVSLGTMVYVIFALFGLKVLMAIAESALWFGVLKFFGAGYLIYIGVKSCRAKAPKPEESDTTHLFKRTMVTPQDAVGTGFFSQISNPKAVLFFISLFTQVIDVRTPTAIKALYGAWMFFATLGWFAFVALVLSHTGVQMRFRYNLHRISLVFGVVLIVLGVLLAFSANPR